MIYDLIDAKRQWQNYLNNLNLVNVPVFGTPSSMAATGGGLSFMFFYSYTFIDENPILYLSRMT
jgi:hypothetical protein